MKDLSERMREEAERQDRLHTEGALESLPYTRLRRYAKEPSQVYSVRIPVSWLAALRRLADHRGEHPTALVREWVLERLDAELGAPERPTPEQASTVGEAPGMPWSGRRATPADVRAAVAMLGSASPSPRGKQVGKRTKSEKKSASSVKKAARSGARSGRSTTAGRRRDAQKRAGSSGKIPASKGRVRAAGKAPARTRRKKG